MAQRGKQSSVESTRFAMVPRNDVPRSAFTVTHAHKTTFDAGYLIPVYVDEVLPGDTFSVNMSAFCRLATPLVPIMDNLQMESFFFFVPYRLVWSNWEKFMGEQASPTDTTSYLTPYVTITEAALAPHTLADYMGITLSGGIAAASINVSAFPFRAYNLIWNEWFRDQDLNAKTPENMGDGPDAETDYALAYRSKRHDYFTSARPWPQKPTNQLSTGSLQGQFAPGLDFLIPRGVTVGAPVTGLGVGSAAAPTVGAPTSLQTGVRNVVLASPHWTTADDPFLMAADPTTSYPDVRVLVQDMRTANMIQQFLEKNARGGSRYAEIIRSHFGVVSPDARLQRPEYLGGGKANIIVNPVAQTSATQEGTTVLGELAGVGSGVATGHGFSRSFTEHGVILGLVSIRADLTYQQGIERMWFRRSIFDFYWPSTAHLGEQAILSRELYADGSPGNNDDDLVFGYQERWAEYKYKQSRTSGYFRSIWATPLDMWHLGQLFADRASATLGSTFLQDNPPVDRVLQVDTTETAQFLLDTYFRARLVRAMPMFSVPGIGSRF